MGEQAVSSVTVSHSPHPQPPGRRGPLSPAPRMRRTVAGECTCWLPQRKRAEDKADWPSLYFLNLQSRGSEASELSGPRKGTTLHPRVQQPTTIMSRQHRFQEPLPWKWGSHVTCVRGFPSKIATSPSKADTSKG